MKIIAHKSIKYDYFTFLRENINNPKITGVAFDIVMTKDKKVIIYTPYGDYISTIDALQSNTYENLKNIDIIPLEETLRFFSRSNKKIIINLLPIVSPPTDEETLFNVNRLNEEYVNAVNIIISKFPTLEFYICSAYDNLVFQMKRLNHNYKVGFIITNLSTNYIDVDFYAFTTNMIDKKIIDQQLNINKEVMIYIINCDDMNMIMNNFSKEQFYYPNIKNTFNEIFFINNYPTIFWNIFN